MADHIFAVTAAGPLLDDIGLAAGGLEIDFGNDLGSDFAIVGPEGAISANDLVGSFRPIFRLGFFHLLHDGSEFGSVSLAKG